MSAEPISDDTLVRVEEKLARMKGLDVLDGRQFSGNTVAAMLARIRALEADREAHMIALGEHAEARRVAEAAVARKDAALRPFAKSADLYDAPDDDDGAAARDDQEVYLALEDGDLIDGPWTVGDLRRARAALGPWGPTHQHMVEHGYGFCRKVLTTSPKRAGDDDLITVFQMQDGRLHYCHAKTFSTAKWFRPLTPDEARAAVEGRS